LRVYPFAVVLFPLSARLGGPPDCFTLSSDGDAGLWFPCVDQRAQRCSFDLRIRANAGLVVAATGAQQPGTDADIRAHAQQQSHQQKHASSAMDAFSSSSSSSSSSAAQPVSFEPRFVDAARTRCEWHFREPLPLQARHVAFAVGPFVVVPDRHRPLSVHHYCLPAGDARHPMAQPQRTAALVSRANASLHAVLQCYERLLGTDFPFAMLRHVYVHAAAVDRAAFAGVAVIAHALLRADDDMDAAVDASGGGGALCAARCWLEPTLLVRAPAADEWIVEGVVRWVAERAFEAACGKAASEWRRMATNDRVCELEVC
jgi:hypothetical protein